MTSEPKWTSFDPNLAERVTEMAKAIQQQTVAGLKQTIFIHSPREIAHLIRIGAYREQDIQWESQAMKRYVLQMAGLDYSTGVRDAVVR